jgi:NADP-dependent 3-hydroxy acid dehydrogenase YdfG
MFEQGLARWKGKAALVTGASSGIGEAIARRLAELEMRVALAARRQEHLERLKSEINGQGGQALVVAADLRHEADIQQLFAAVRGAWGGVDVLVNNAGLGRESRFATGDPADWRDMLEVNVFAVALCIREALADMKGKPDALIANISSLAGHRVPLGRNVTYYSATKHAVRAITDGLRDELVQEQSPIKVGMISPGVVETEFHERFFRDRKKGQESYRSFKALEPADVADALTYMLAVPRHVQVHDIVLRPIAQPH